MFQIIHRLCYGTVIGFGLITPLPADDPPAPPQQAGASSPASPDLSAFRTVETAETTGIAKSASAVGNTAGYLGVSLLPEADGKLVVADVADNSPAAHAGLQPGDVLVQVAGQSVASAEALQDLLQSRAAGEEVTVIVLRDEKPVELTATLGAASRPMKPTTQRAVLGLRVGDPAEGEGVPIEQITPGSSADKAKLKVGEIILKADGVPLTSSDKLREVLSDKKPNDTVTLTLLLADKAVDLKVQVTAPPGSGRGSAWDDRPSPFWKKEVYRLAVVCVEFPDAKHNDKVNTTDWEAALFSDKTYVEKSPTGQTVFGSMSDYYREQSCGAMRVEGKVFDWIEVSKNRMDYTPPTGTSNKSVLLNEALDKLLERDGAEALDGFDGLLFVYAGGRVSTNRGAVYWPHRANVTHKGKRWGYVIVAEGGERMATISVICHEFGHLLGLPDLYARPENPGSEGLGVWCAMSNQSGNGRPQHFSAWCKEQLGWLKPAVIDPTVPQKLVLGPVEDTPNECFKVLIKRDGSEYLLLENRRKKGFDQSLPGEGLLIWRIVNRKPILEESHGVEGPAGPNVFAGSVPYPSAANDSFTPFTTPSSRSMLGGGLPVFISNIRQLPDGRVTFYVGYKYL